MLSEENLIPFACSPLPAGPYLVFAPHPDDETLGMGGTIARAADAGIPVEVVVLTDGAAGGARETRMEEAERAAAVLGVSKIHFWNLPDRKLHEVPLPETESTRLLETLNPQTVFLPSPQEYHPDHRSATARLLSLMKRRGFDGEVWLYEISRQGEANRLIDVTGVTDRKIRAVRCYESQLAQNSYEAVALAINCARALTLPPPATHAEAFWAGRGPDVILKAYWKAMDACLEGIGLPHGPGAGLFEAQAVDVAFFDDFRKLQREVSELREELSRMRFSLSWKITKPLRALRRLQGRRPGKG